MQSGLPTAQCAMLASAARSPTVMSAAEQEEAACRICSTFLPREGTRKWGAARRGEARRGARGQPASVGQPFPWPFPPCIRSSLFLLQVGARPLRQAQPPPPGPAGCSAGAARSVARRRAPKRRLLCVEARPEVALRPERLVAGGGHEEHLRRGGAGDGERQQVRIVGRGTAAPCSCGRSQRHNRSTRALLAAVTTKKRMDSWLGSPLTPARMRSSSARPACSWAGVRRSRSE